VPHTRKSTQANLIDLIGLKSVYDKTNYILCSFKGAFCTYKQPPNTILKYPHA